MSRQAVECEVCGNQRWLYATSEAPSTCRACEYLMDVFRHPAGEWVVEGLCGEVDPELFYPPPNSAATEAKSVCAACGVRELCLTYALENEERFGVWGGLTPRERKRLMKKGTAA